MAFHLEDNAVAIINIDNAGIFAWTLDDARALGRQRAKPLLGRLVGAVLVPHGGKDAKLGEAWFPADEIQNPLIFVRLQAVGGNEFGSDLDAVGNRHLVLYAGGPDGVSLA